MEDRNEDINTLDVPYKKKLSQTLKSSVSFSASTLRKITSVLTLGSPTEEIIAATQLGLYYSLGKLSQIPDRDVLMEDFFQVNIYYFPSEGSYNACTPPHKFTDFKFKDFAPVAFRYFRKFFGIKPEDFMQSACKDNFNELSNAGASGSLFFKSADDLYVIKTVDNREAKFLQRLLPGYYLNIEQNKNTLMPKFFGLYNYSSLTQNLRIVIMNNLLPSSFEFQEKYDIKGSTFKRRASVKELKKNSSTLKDLDFVERHPNGLILEPKYFNLLMSTLERDARVLCSFKIMDYSLLIGIHNVTKSIKLSGSIDEQMSQQLKIEAIKEKQELTTNLRGLILENEQSLELANFGGLPAKNENGDDLILFVGIIDILQNYRLQKRLEYKFKSLVTDPKSVSVNKPRFYQQRFLDFCRKRVFKTINLENTTTKMNLYMTAPHPLHIREYIKTADVFEQREIPAINIEDEIAKDELFKEDNIDS